MIIKVFDDKPSLAKTAATQATTALRSAIAARNYARLIAATGAAQFEFLEILTATPNIAWQNVELFHLDEYIGLPANHPASFCKFLEERLISKTGITNHHLLHPTADPADLIRSVNAAISSAPVDIAFAGIGENGHLAFNDPPADFQITDPYIIVNLDHACRQQQVGEGWFRNLDEVPKQAISMSVQQILKTKEILCIVPDARKAQAIHACFDGKISPMAPASILRTHPNTTIYLDRHSAQLLSPATLSKYAAPATKP